jgi:DNA topoisomerase-1
MAKSLVIVESPSKAKTIGKYLGKDFHVEATVGHIKNLPAKDLAVDIENGFVPHYVTIRGKGEVIKSLQQWAAKARAVYIATDPDREGEAIASHIAAELEKQTREKPVYRVLFNEITKTGIKEAMSNPRTVDERLVQAQQARRVLDRIVGYKVSPFLWKTIYMGLSAGRVQSVALRFICERELEIRAFVEREYWSITSEFQKQGDGSIHTKLAKIGGRDPEIPDEASARGILERLARNEYRITDIQQREINRNPPAPFITSTLQQEASNRLRFGAKRTMMVAQELYEGIDLGEEGAVGLITYMRTDSTRSSNEAITEVRNLIGQTYGPEFVPASPRQFKAKASAQDAHEAIRPTSLEYTPQRVRPFLTSDQYQLYELIWKRFLASQMSQALLSQTTVLVEGGEFTFKGVGSVYKFRGFLQVYDDFETDNNNGDSNEEETLIPDGLVVGDKVDPISFDPHQHFTKPPPRYTESSLIKELEAKGIGRPSTYAMIVSTIQERGYTEQKDRKLFATELGLAVNKLLNTYFSQLFNVEFTAKMEGELDTIASGEASYLKVMKDFYVPFAEHLSSLKPENARLIEESDQVCDNCGKPMVIRWGRNGRFLSCSGYPECRSARPLPEDMDKMKINEPCPECGGALMLKQSRYGKFIGCSSYPACKFTKPITLGVTCPTCGKGELVERMSKTKRMFYGCVRYPECNFVSWDRPVPQVCPSCKNHYLLRKYTQKKGEFLRCPKCQQEFSLDLNPLDSMHSVA